MSSTYEIASFIDFEAPELLIRAAEDIGTSLGMISVSRTQFICARLQLASKGILSGERPIQDLGFLWFLKPKLAALVANSTAAERSELERFRTVLLDGIDCVIESGESVRYERLKRLKQFVEAVVAYQRYALTSEMKRYREFVQTSTKRVKVFLSHSHLDKPFAEKLYRALEAKGVDTWYDNKDLNIGDNISDSISEGIKRSFCFLIVVSPVSVKSKWVKYELDEAYEAHISEGKRILPILIGNLLDSDIPQRLRKHLYADFREESNYQENFGKLYRAIVIKRT